MALIPVLSFDTRFLTLWQGVGFNGFLKIGCCSGGSAWISLKAFFLGSLSYISSCRFGEIFTDVKRLAHTCSGNSCGRGDLLCFLPFFCRSVVVLFVGVLRCLFVCLV